MQKKILVTGGAGYIGSHTLVELLQANYQVVVLDNLCNSQPEALHRVEQITGKPIPFVQGDIRDAKLLDTLFAEHIFDAVIHFAGLKAVGESVEQPLKYFDNNVTGSLNLLEAMQKAGVHRIVFSSSATVYGEAEEMPIRESTPLQRPTNPYGRSKFMVEEIMRDLAESDTNWSIGLLRYFNPVGAHKSGLIGEDPFGIPNNLVPFISQVAVGRRKQLAVYGNDYDTHDGTGVRDYIHVVDLAKGHLAALSFLLQESDLQQRNKGAHVWNLGTGNGYSVLDVVQAFEQASQVDIPYQMQARRAGDIAVCYADPQKALQELGWQAQYDLERMMQDTWRWQQQNPAGYASATQK